MIREMFRMAYEKCSKYKRVFFFFLIASVQFSRSVVSDSLWPHESQHARPPCPSPTPRVHSDSCSLSQWCHPAISSSVIPFSSCPQSLPASKSLSSRHLQAWCPHRHLLNFGVVSFLLLFLPSALWFYMYSMQIFFIFCWSSKATLTSSAAAFFMVALHLGTVLVIHFKYSSVYMSIPNSLTIPALPHSRKFLP